MPEVIPPVPDNGRFIKEESVAQRSVLKNKLALLNIRGKGLGTEQEAGISGQLKFAKTNEKQTNRKAQTRREDLTTKHRKKQEDQAVVTTKRQVAETTEREIRETATMLDTANLVDLSAHDAERVTDQMVRLEVDAADVVQVETASSQGYETHDFLTLAQMAARLGRPVLENGQPALPVLSRPETKHFLAMLAALQRAYNTSLSKRPTELLRELETSDLAALLRGFANHLDQNRPGFFASNTYKWRDLMAVAEDFFENVNGQRQSTGTELYRKVFIDERLDS